MEEKQSALDPNLMVLAGMIKGLEYGVRALITTHPDPEAFGLAWQALLPLIADAHTELGATETPAFRDGMQSILGRLTAQAELGEQHGQTPPG